MDFNTMNISIVSIMTCVIMFCSACTHYHQQEDVGIPTDFLGDTIGVKKVLKEIKPMTSSFNKHDKIFFKAAYKGDIKKIRTMLKEGYNANVTDKYGYNALIWAVRGENVEVVEELSNHSFSWDVINDEGKGTVYFINMIVDLEIKEKIINIRNKSKNIN